MKNLIKHKDFGVGFLIGIIVIVLLNIFFPTETRCELSNLCDYSGFPFAFYQAGYEEREGGNYVGEFLWLGLMGDVLFAFLTSFLAGLSVRLLADGDVDLK